MNRALALFVMRHQINSISLIIAFAIASLIFSPFSLLSSGIVALNSLRKGLKQGLLLVIISFAVTLLLMGITQNSILAILFLGLFWLPVLLPAWVLRKTENLAMALVVTLVFGVIVVSGVFIAFSGADPASVLQPYITQFIQQLESQQALNITSKEQEYIIAFLAKTGLELFVTIIYLHTILALVIGRWWQAILFNKGGFQKEFHQISMSKSWVFLSSLILGITFFVKSPYLFAVSSLFIFPFLFQGLSVMHAFLKKNKRAPIFLTLLYLMLLTQFSFFIVLIGIIDNWLHFRARFNTLA